MAVLSTSEAVASRFSRYIDELHEVFAQHRIPYGAPADLATLADRLAAPGLLAEDTSSILRSTILREGGSLPHAELAEILAVAAGGPDAELAEDQPTTRTLFAFVASVMRRPWNQPPGEEPPTASNPNSDPAQAVEGQTVELCEDSVPALAENTPEYKPTPSGHEVHFSEAHAAASNTAPPQELKAATEDAAAPPPRAIFSALRMTAAVGADPHPDALEDEQVERMAHDREDTADSPLPLLPPPQPGSSAPLWIGALCALALIVALSFWTRLLYAPSTRLQAQPAATAAPLGNATTRSSLPVQFRPAASVSASAAKPTAATGDDPVRSSDDAASVARPSRRKPSAEIIADPTYTSYMPAPRAASSANSAQPSPTVQAPPAAPHTEIASSAPEGWSRMPTPLHPAQIDGPYFEVSSGVMASHLLESEDPSYPALARLTHTQGKVILQAVISTDGEVVATHVLSGHRLLRGAASDAVKHWRYKPFVMDGHPVSVATIVTVAFHSHH